MSHKRHEDFASIMLTLVLPGQEATPQRCGNSTQQQHGSQGTKKGLLEALLSNQGYLAEINLVEKARFLHGGSGHDPARYRSKQSGVTHPCLWSRYGC